MKYIDNKPENGLVYDYKKVRKMYKKLGCPKEYYDPTTCPIERVSWIVEASSRSTGKTTNWLLYGLIMYWLYGTVMHYVRGTEAEIMPKISGTMYKVIVEKDYISKMTDGEYNNIIYKSRKWTLVHTNDNGDIDKIAPSHCTYMCCVDKAGQLKSAHNEPLGDLIIFDEFISINFRAFCDFIPFCDLCKTILRDRLSGKIVLLANTIDKEHQYFHELEIYERINELDIGENCIHTTDGGTNIYIEIVGTPVVLKSRKRKFNKMFMAFKNPRLAGITGESTWSIRQYPHVPDTDYKTIFCNTYISHNNKLVRLDIVHNDFGTCIYAHWATKYHEDSILLVSREVQSPQERFGLADETSLGGLIREIALRHKLYFSSNDVGTFVQNYLNQCGINIPLS